MSNTITGIERAIVLDYIAQEGSFLVYSRVDSQKQCILSQGIFKIIQKKIVFFPTAVFADFLFSDARIRFFYRGRGLYFDSEIQRVKNGFAFTIPNEIQKMADQISIQNQTCTGSLYYSGSNNKPVELLSLKDFPVFNANREVTLNGLDYLQQVSHSFLTTNIESDSPIEKRAAQLFILEVTDSAILLGMKGDDIALEKDDVYFLELKVPAGVVKRRIRLKCAVTDIQIKQNTKNSQYGFTAICDLIGTKLEDQRFLYEKFFDRKFS